MPAMHRFLRRHWLPLLRVPALAVLLLAVLANPVLAAIGDLHEIGEGGGHVHAVEAPPHGHATDHAAAHDDENPSLLHALMHASHCCGHLTAIVPHTLPLMSPPPAQALVASAGCLSPTRRLEPRFRPPIIG